MWKWILGGLGIAGVVWLSGCCTPRTHCRKPNFKTYEVRAPFKAQADALKAKYHAATVRAATSGSSRMPWQAPQPGMVYSQVMTHWLLALDANGCFLGGEQFQPTASVN
jgi:hypothetical protein